MSNKEWSAFSFLLALVFAAFSPLDAPGGLFVAISGGVLFWLVAVILLFKKDKPLPWPGGE